jgi:hypothetical protein
MTQDKDGLLQIVAELDAPEEVGAVAFVAEFDIGDKLRRMCVELFTTFFSRQLGPREKAFFFKKTAKFGAYRAVASIFEFGMSSTNLQRNVNIFVYVNRFLKLIRGTSGAVSVLEDQEAEGRTGAAGAVKKGNLQALNRFFDTDPNLSDYRGAVGESLLHLCYLYHPKDQPNEIARLILRRAPHLVNSVYEGDVYRGENVSIVCRWLTSLSTCWQSSAPQRWQLLAPSPAHTNPILSLCALVSIVGPSYDDCQ